MIAGIDPSYAKPIAIALWKDKLIATFKFDAELNHSVVDALVKIFKSVEKVYIEDQYFSQNADTLKKLSRCTGELIGICKMVHTEYELVAPATWQSRAGLYGKRPKDLTDYKWKKLKNSMLIKAAAKVSNSDPVDEDEASAIMIAYVMSVKKCK
ncbi:MAG: hypothetical protein E3J23_08490 [Candidatus Stahlbacteria bacterium]|nr:MAG: hypothetical protein E3J23_08490 [Candidatus Stahlbacteria bacterium]